MKRILVVEDEPDIALSLKVSLESIPGLTVETVASGQAGLEQALATPPALVLLDLNLPDRDGLEVCRELRRDPRTARLPILVLTARAEETDRVRGLDLGADDYITKPFSPRELAARVRAALRRAGGGPGDDEALEVGRVLLDPASRRVRAADRDVDLTRREFDLLMELMRQAGRVLGRDLLLERVWGYRSPAGTRTVDVHVRKLREKLGEEAGGQIETVIGVGYRFRSPA